MTAPSVPTDEEWASLAGHRFPGGTRTVEHWENWLLTDCAERAPMSDGLLHPVVLFHVPIQAAGTSIGEILAMAGGGAPGSVTLLGYDWEYLQPLREEVPYRGQGGIVATQRHRRPDGTVSHDELTFAVELVDPDDVIVARATTRWRFPR